MAGLEVVLSPTQCSMVRLGDNGKLKWVKLFSLEGDFGNSMRDGMFSHRTKYAQSSDPDRNVRSYSGRPDADSSHGHQVSVRV